MFVCPECGQSFERAGHCTADGARLADGSGDPVLGQTIGSYRVARLIGAGAMGTVYKGVHPGIGSRVAIKVLSHDPARSPTLVERFFAEARAVNLIRHEHIVNVLDLSALPDGRPYIVMEYLDGESLASVLARNGRLPLGTLARMLSEVLGALAAAHEKGIIHRDLKPDNLFVTPNGHVKVLDFGIAKLRGEIGSAGDGTRTGALLGTPHYMSPEQALARPVDARADLYAVGVIAFEAATGRKPFDAGSLYELLQLHIERPPPSPSALRPDLPPAYEGVILRALDKDPTRRFQSAAELSHALGEATRTLPEEAWARVSVGQTRTASMAAATETPHAGAWSGVGASHALRSAPPAVAASAPPTAPSPGAVAFGSHSGNAAVAWGPPQPQPRGSSGGVVALMLAIFAVVLLGGALLVIAALVTRSDDAPASVASPTSPATATTTVASPGFSMPARGMAPGTIRPAGFDPKTFDVWKFFDEATKLATQEQADARFVRLDANGIAPDGRIDLTGGTSTHVLYRFRSPSLSKPPAGHPENRKYSAKCIIYVYVDETGVRTYPASWTCDMPFLPKPRCSPAQVWSRSKAPGGNLVANIGYWADDRGHARWYLDVTDRFSGFVPDSC